MLLVFGVKPVWEVVRVVMGGGGASSEMVPVLYEKEGEGPDQHTCSVSIRDALCYTMQPDWPEEPCKPREWGKPGGSDSACTDCGVRSV